MKTNPLSSCCQAEVEYYQDGNDVYWECQKCKKLCGIYDEEQKLHEVAQKANQDQRELMEKSSFSRRQENDEEWIKEFEKKFGDVWVKIKDRGDSGCPVFERKNRELLKFISQQISLAEERGRKEEREKVAQQMQEIVQRYFENFLHLPCPDFTFNLPQLKQDK